MLTKSDKLFIFFILLFMSVMIRSLIEGQSILLMIIAGLSGGLIMINIIYQTPHK